MTDSSTILFSRQYYNFKHHPSRSFHHDRNFSRDHDHSSQPHQPTPTQSPAPRKPLKPSSRHDSIRPRVDTFLKRSPLDIAHNADLKSRAVRSQYTSVHTNLKHGSKTNLMDYLQNPAPTSLHQLPVHPHFGPVPSVESPEQQHASDLEAIPPSTPTQIPPRTKPSSPTSPQQHLLEETLNSIRKAARDQQDIFNASVRAANKKILYSDRKHQREVSLRLETEQDLRRQLAVALKDKQRMQQKCAELSKLLAETQQRLAQDRSESTNVFKHLKQQMVAQRQKTINLAKDLAASQREVEASNRIRRRQQEQLEQLERRFRQLFSLRENKIISDLDPAPAEVQKESVDRASGTGTSSMHESDSGHAGDTKLFKRMARKPSGLPTDTSVLLRVLTKLRKNTAPFSESPNQNSSFLDANEKLLLQEIRSDYPTPPPAFVRKVLAQEQERFSI